jgi:hypothetical protein
MGFAFVDHATGRLIGSSRYYGYAPELSDIEIGWTPRSSRALSNTKSRGWKRSIRRSGATSCGCWQDHRRRQRMGQAVLTVLRVFSAQARRARRAPHALPHEPSSPALTAIWRAGAKSALRTISARLLITTAPLVAERLPP